ncbi:MAG: extracellular solute-binding protein [Spirochaetales bacterium]|nr:extracellular solute-binding protein [Spirochaetales bacterium]
MNRNKKSIGLILLLGLIILAATGSTTPNIAAEEKKVVLSLWSFWDEPKRFIERFEGRHPNITIEMTIVPCENYLEKLKPILRSGTNAPDIFAGEYSHVKEIVESGYWDDLSSAPYNADVSDVLPYILEVGKDSKGKLRGLSWQACVGSFIYRRSTAKQYLGTDDPKKVGEMLSTPEKFLNTARILNKKSNGAVKLIANYREYKHYPLAAAKRPLVSRNKRLQIEQGILDYFDFAGALVDEELTADTGQWSPKWFDNMNSDEPQFMGYVLPTWGLHYVIKPNAHQTVGDWAICRGPSSYFWGGTWMGIYSGSRNKKAAWEFLKFVTLNRDTLEWWAKETGEFVASKKVINKIKNDFSDEYLAGQNHYEFFAAEALKINGALLTKYDLEIQDLMMNEVSACVENNKNKAQAVADWKEEANDYLRSYPEWNSSAPGTDQGVYEDDDRIVLTVWSFSDEIEKLIRRFEAGHPEINVILENIPYFEYANKITAVLKEGMAAPDVFVVSPEQSAVFMESGFGEDLSAAPYKAKVSDMFPFTVQAGRDSHGKLRLLSWQAWPGAFYFRRSLAKRYLGTDDPEKIGEMLSTEEKFIATGLRLHEKSDGKIKLIAGWQDYIWYALAMRKKPFVTGDGRFVLDEAVARLFAVAKVLQDQGLAEGYGMWSPDWFDGMKQDSDIFGYSLPEWGLHYVLKSNASDSSGDWGVCKGPASYFVGGSWLGINSNSRNKQAAWEFIKFITLNRETLEWWAQENGELVNSKTVVDKLKNEITDEYIDGQKYFHYFAAEAAKVDGSLFTEYDYEITDILKRAIGDYVDGRLTQKEAVKQFVRDVKDEFPDLIVE